MRRLGLRILFALALIWSAYAIRAPLLKREIWNVDEGATFTMGQQVLKGAVLYRDAADARAPLVPYLKALVFALFGSWNAHAVHVVVALGLGVSAVFVWQIARALAAERAGIAAAIVFTALTFTLLGLPDTMAAHTEWFLLFFSVIGYLVFATWAPRHGRFAAGTLAGVAFGLAALCKQPGLLDLGTTWILCGLLWWEKPAERKRLVLFALGELAGVIGVFALTLLYFGANHALPDLVFYAWTYNTRYYVAEVPLPERLATIRVPFYLLWHHARAIALVGSLGAGWMLLRSARSLIRRNISELLFCWLVLGWTSAGLVSTVLSGRDFTHYSIQIIPGVSLACGWLVDQSLKAAGGAPRGRLFLKGLTVVASLVVLFWLSGDVSNRRRALVSEDDGSKAVGAIVQEYTVSKDRIFVWGYVPELYYFSRRLPSSRFIYTNYVTGLIPWTNLDPLRDTSYASVPGSWKQLENDLREKPPEIVVDTGTARGYAKYLLTNQEELWEIIRSGYTEVEPTSLRIHGVRLFRRDPVITPAPLEKNLPAGPEVKLIARIVPQGTHDLTLLTVTAPAGAAQIDLYRNGMLYRSVKYPTHRPCEVCFWVDNTGQPTTVEYQAVLRKPDGDLLSPSCRTGVFGPAADLSPTAQNAGPCLVYGTRRLATAVAESAGLPIEAGPLTERWSGTAPARFVYARTRGMTALILTAGANIFPAKREGPVRFTVSFVFPGGSKQQLQERFLNIDPQRTEPGEDLQKVRAVLPGADPGEIVVEFFPAGSPEAVYPEIFVANIRAQGSGPDLVLSPSRILVPEEGYSVFDGILNSPDDGHWASHAPSFVVYQCPPDLHAVVVGFGLRDGSYFDPDNGRRRTDGIEAVVAFRPKGSEEKVIFRRLLDPFNRPEDRGPQNNRVLLPDAPQGGTLRLMLTTGPHNDPSYDWAYMTEFTGELAP